ncbi:SDR family NAD(P)-dependent oxidoreductase [Thermobifida fusca]|uniref:Short chain dehydrogenase n=2 Tax=Thermobifida fusca TaxID=2021 RepID=A0A9P2WRH4_THEFU|nr:MULTISPECIES: SDR family NAD(P)-dependent oxidoreductase [Thermobifida]AAZ55317.1 short chain dehydrogenase [Thermobifida fusca YX]EOR71628.1 short chain dehydrogenase [Thermobifida fusca TM51]MBO2528636.1 3-hydroxyacyl-CoA dehydrogenase [Thermobifida sp.]MDD6791522.1 SDR family NAD(P)-dependent oxidoreductase [Thermobifida fusca]PPS93190.1 3-hydroxy-2-methylbutyryl-CoA dehydrogenase [Thermobifida fusca]
MDVNGASVVVTGGASGLGAATAARLAKQGAHVVIIDLPQSKGAEVAKEIGGQFGPADVTDTDAVNAALDLAEAKAPLRALVHCAGRGATVRVVEKDGSPGSMETYEEIVRVNLFGTFNMLRLAAARMAKNDVVDEERGVCVLTASVAAYEGQIGQIPYASAKAGVVGMTLVAARDLASKKIRVATIAPGVFDTPILSRFPQELRDALGKSVPHPNRLGHVDEYAMLAHHIIENKMINGEVIRLDGALRMSAR